MPDTQASPIIPREATERTNPLSNRLIDYLFQQRFIYQGSGEGSTKLPLCVYCVRHPSFILCTCLFQTSDERPGQICDSPVKTFIPLPVQVRVCPVHSHRLVHRGALPFSFPKLSAPGTATKRWFHWVTWNPMYGDCLCFGVSILTGIRERPSPASVKVTNGLTARVKEDLIQIPTFSR